MSDVDVGVVDVRIFWVPPGRSPFGTEQKDGLIVVHRVMACGPKGASRQRLPIPESPDRKAGEDDSAAERLLNAFDEYAAKSLVGPAWKKSSEFWVTPVCGDVAAVAEKLSGFHDQWHDLILGKPVEYLTGSPILSGIATELTLPGDAWFAETKRLVQIGGILFGLASGQPLLVNACLKSLVHSAILRVVSETIGAFLNSTMEPVGACERDLETILTKEELDHIAELQESPASARDDQSVPEEPAPAKSLSDQNDPPYRPQPFADPNTIFAAGQRLHSSEEQTTQTNKTTERAEPRELPRTERAYQQDQGPASEIRASTGRAVPPPISEPNVAVADRSQPDRGKGPPGRQKSM